MSLPLMAWIAGSVLGLGGAVLAVVAVLPSKRRDPHDGMARGCLLLMSIGLFSLAGLVAAGAVWNVPFLVKGGFGIVSFVAVLLAAQGVFFLVHRARRRG